MKQFCCYLKEAVDSLVTDGRFSLILTYKILKVLLKALLVLQETHGYVIIGVTVIQLRKESPAKEIVESNLLHIQKQLKRIIYILDVSSPAVEGLDIVDVPENGLFLARDIGRRIGAVCVLHVMGGEEFHLLDKL